MLYCGAVHTAVLCCGAVQCSPVVWCSTVLPSRLRVHWHADGEKWKHYCSGMQVAGGVHPRWLSHFNKLIDDEQSSAQVSRASCLVPRASCLFCTCHLTPCHAVPAPLVSSAAPLSTSPTTSPHLVRQAAAEEGLRRDLPQPHEFCQKMNKVVSRLQQVPTYLPACAGLG